MADKLLRGYSTDGTIRLFCAITTDTVKEAQRIHHTYPVSTAALGRALTGAALMGATLKNEDDSVTLQFKGNGPLSFIVAVSGSDAKVRGYVSNPAVDRPLNDKGKLDVGGALGEGYLSVIRDLGLKEPYIGQIPLVSGEIAEDLTMYYARSEQIPTSVGLGVLVDTDNTPIAAGGFMLQLLPGATDEDAEKLEKIISEIPAVTTMISEGMTCEDIMFKITEGFDIVIENNGLEPEYKCRCSKERMENALRSIGKEELSEIINDTGFAELTCQFCDNKFKFERNDLEKLLKEAK